ncbi:hypothetical protein P5673_019308 [Acropora cervicornis]|uniref:Uncharacterized protein n=1 Tax=Acropora cervicornis TaxID=6130 RepID=A0AAD9QB90_ACRCE|nr:hypothetical protein P5673_019308 [Acropora cervicornis]
MDTHLSTFQYGQNIKHAHGHGTWKIQSSISEVERDGATRTTKHLTKRIKECVVRGRTGDGIKERRLG